MTVADSRSVPQLIRALDEGEAVRLLFFWGHRPAEDARITKTCFSQWYEAPFEVADITYPSTEHYMMAAKAALFGDMRIRESVLAATTPAAAGRSRFPVLGQWRVAGQRCAHGLPRGLVMSLPTESYAAQSRRWPTEGEHVLARFDDESIIVYQAYRPSIGRYAIEHGRLGGPDFSFQRMSWVKPNFLWMMYRSGWGTKGGKRSRWACASSALSSIGSWPKRTVLVRGVGHPGSRRLG